MERKELRCNGCLKPPSEIPEFVTIAAEEGCTPEEFVLREEGTLNPRNHHFLCTDCYIAAGMPSSPTGWTAP